MNPRFRLLLLPLVLQVAVLPLRMVAQAKTQPTSIPTLRAEYRALLRKLGDEKKPPTVAQRLAMLRAFLKRHAKHAHHGQAQMLVLKARLRLGRALLLSFHSREALTELQQVADARPRRPGHRELRGRALYGIAQAQEMLGQVEACRTTLRGLLAEFEDTRYGKFAKVAIERLKRPGSPRNAKPAPAFGPLLDLRGQAVSDTSLRLKPALLLFWSPDIAASMVTVERLAEAWRKAGGDPRQVVAFAVHPDRARVRAAVKKRRWDIPVVPCDTDLLDPVVLAYAVDGVPTSLDRMRQG